LGGKGGMTNSMRRGTTNVMLLAVVLSSMMLSVLAESGPFVGFQSGIESGAAASKQQMGPPPLHSEYQSVAAQPIILVSVSVHRHPWLGSLLTVIWLTTIVVVIIKCAGDSGDDKFHGR
jgi:hypothetical protein